MYGEDFNSEEPATISEAKVLRFWQAATGDIFVHIWSNDHSKFYRMRIWKQPIKLEILNQMSANTMGDALGMTFTEYGDDFLRATMPVNENTVQPMRILHGGASVALAETMGSVASILCLDDISKKAAVGIEINANHLRSVREGGMVTGTVRPVRVGRTLHVWQIDLEDERGKKVCTSRLTVMIIDQRS